jgi:hypothetical protein
LKNIKTIIDELNQGGDLSVIRCTIADLIEYYLQHGKDTNNVVALPFFINAVGTLSLNVNSKRCTSPVGLYSCLIYLEKAIAASEGKAKPSCLNTESIEMPTYDFLIAVLAAIRRMPAFQNTQQYKFDQ